MKKIDRFLNNKKTFIIIIVLSILYLIAFMICGTYYKHFWYDEMATVGFMRTGVSFKEMIEYYLDIEASNLPLFQIIVSVFYHNLPATPLFVLLPTMIFTVAGVILLVILAERISGKMGAYSIIVLSIFSTTVINRMGLLYRTYSFMYFTTVLSLFFIEKIKDDYNIKNIIKLSISLILLVYSHYFGTLMFGMLFMAVFIYGIIKKKGLKRLIPFLIAGVLFAPWFLLAMRTRVASVDSFWIEAPKITKVLETIGFLLGGNIFACVVWAISFGTVFIILIKRREMFSFKGMVLLLPVLILGVIFIYSNIGGSLFEARYFIIILPELMLTIALFFQELWQAIYTKSFGLLIFILEVIVLVIVAVTELMRCHMDTFAEYVKYAGAAKYIIEQNDISNPDTLLITRDYSDVDEVVSLGWYDYYLYRQGYVASNLVVKSAGDFDQTEIIDSYGDKINKVYVFAPEELIGYNGNNFEETFFDNLFRLAVYERKENNHDED